MSVGLDLDARTRTAYERVEAYLAAKRAQVPRPPEGVLRRPFVDPASVYRGQLWDWDAYFTLTALLPHLQDRTIVRDCVLNFLDHQRDDGSVPYVVDARPGGPPPGSAKPVLAQTALLAPGTWVADALPALRRHVRHWEETQLHPSGLFRWRSHRGSGTDNHPAVYGRPPDATAGVDLNCLMVTEYRALAELHAAVGDRERARRYDDLSGALADLVRRLLWDPVMHDFCPADTLTTTPPGVTQEADWLVPLRYRSWVGFYALWAGVATPEQADLLVDASDLFCDFGIRTLSRREPLYDVSASANPSNWRGPVWLVANYIAFTGLLRYGFTTPARDVLTGTLELLADDLERTGTLHEYYDPDGGEGVTGAGFLNWNLLATTMYHDYLERV